MAYSANKFLPETRGFASTHRSGHLRGCPPLDCTQQAAEGLECVWCLATNAKPQSNGRVAGIVDGWGKMFSDGGGALEQQHIRWFVKVFLIEKEKKGACDVAKGVVLRRHLMAQKKKKKDPSGVMARIEARHAAAAAGDERAALAIFIAVYGSEKACTSGAGGGGGGAVGGMSYGSSTPSGEDKEFDPAAPAKAIPSPKVVPDSPELSPAPQRGPVRNAGENVSRDLLGVGAFDAVRAV